MRHYEIEDWVDFVRGIVPREVREAMQQHLDGGCEICDASARFITHLAETTAADRLYDAASASLASAAIRAFASRMAEDLNTLVASLIFDSALELQTVGVRATQPVTRHLMYEAGSYVVDVRLEQPSSGSGSLLIGQIVNRLAPETALSEIPVSLLAGKRLVSTSRSDRFGEFIIDYEEVPDLLLRFSLVAAGQQIEVRLAALYEENGENISR